MMCVRAPEKQQQQQPKKMLENNSAPHSTTTKSLRVNLEMRSVFLGRQLKIKNPLPVLFILLASD
jgi:hypothetical protein